MSKDRILVKIEFEVDEEMAPGMFYSPQEFVDSTCSDIKLRLMAYNPIIKSKSFKYKKKEGE